MLLTYIIKMSREQTKLRQYLIQSSSSTFRILFLYFPVLSPIVFSLVSDFMWQSDGDRDSRHPLSLCFRRQEHTCLCPRRCDSVGGPYLKPLLWLRESKVSWSESPAISGAQIISKDFLFFHFNDSLNFLLTVFLEGY